MKQKEAVERLGDGFHNLSQGVADLNIAMNKAGQECLNTLLKNLPSEITNYHCPDCGCNLLFDHIDGDDVVLYCLECDHRVKAKMLPKEEKEVMVQNGKRR